MGLVDTVKAFVGSSPDPNEYRCAACGASVESHLDPDEPFLSCEECGSRDLERTDAS